MKNKKINKNIIYYIREVVGDLSKGIFFLFLLFFNLNYSFTVKIWQLYKIVMQCLIGVCFLQYFFFPIYFSN